MPLEVPLVQALRQHARTEASDAAWIQSFEVGNLELMRGQTRLPLVQLVEAKGGPADRAELSYRAMTTPAGLATVATYADVLGPPLSLVLNDDLTPTPLVDDATRAGLAVHAWTVRPENAFLPRTLWSSDDPAERGDVAELVRALEAAGVAGVFTDDPAATLAALGR